MIYYVYSVSIQQVTITVIYMTFTTLLIIDKIFDSLFILYV